MLKDTVIAGKNISYKISHADDEIENLTQLYFLEAGFAKST
jgi:hypothetical protein